jgi:hypothetical protein
MGLESIAGFRTTPETSDSAQSISFLRRFADLMSGGRNAGTLLQAADVIEDLANRVEDVEQQLREEAERCAAYRDLCTVADLAVGDMKFEVATLEQRLGAEQLRHELAQASLAEENQRLIIRAGQAEAKLTEMSGELLNLRAELAGLGDSLLLVPAATMRMARDQFQSLANGCEKSGDTIAVVMCEIGSRLMEQAIAGSTLEAEG